MTWDYDAAVDASLNLESISGHANSLLADIAANRDPEDIPPASIISSGLDYFLVRENVEPAHHICRTQPWRNNHQEGE